MRGDEAKEKCPEINLVRVPEARGKANLTLYREAGAEVIAVLSRFCDSCERASVDEAYLDLTENVKIRMSTMDLDEIAEKSAASTFLEGFMIGDGDKKHVDATAWRASLEDDENIKRLAVGAIIVSEMREAVLRETQFTCSAGIAHNKMLAKLGGGRHKPNKQSLLPQFAVPELFETVRIQKVRNMGGKLGHEVCSNLKAEKMSDLAKYSMSELQGRFGDKTGEWLFQISRGVDHEPVRPRQLPKSTGCGKNFPGKSKLATGEQVKYWIDQLASELNERLTRESELNNRDAKLLNVGFRTENDTSFLKITSRSCHLKNSSAEQIARDAYNLLLPFNSIKDNKTDTWYPAIVTLQISASKFEEINDHNNTPSISSFFNKKNKTETTTVALNEQVSKSLAENEKNIGFSSVNLPNDSTREPSLVPEGRDEENPKEQVRSIKNEEESSNNGKTSHTSKVKDNAHTEKKGIEVFFSGKNSNDRKLKNSERLSRNPYLGCEIDSDVLESLPEEIRREIKQSLVQSSRGGKKAKEGSNFFGPCESTSGKESTSHNETPSTSENDGFSDGETLAVDCTDLQKCEQCGQRLPDWEMPEHLDYHFALELQKVERNSTADAKSNVSINEPPKKKQRTTIQSFFTPK
ncbi:hypothetical protein ACROYT_G035767 [Oculina patagonica]